ncbi:hypothetical protein D3C84_1113480 [compost metagenome]
MSSDQRIREAQVLDERREYQQQALGFLAIITFVQCLGQLHRSQGVAVAVAPPRGLEHGSRHTQTCGGLLKAASHHVEQCLSRLR